MEKNWGDTPSATLSVNLNISFLVFIDTKVLVVVYI